jgi:hypothetical protein
MRVRISVASAEWNDFDGRLKGQATFEQIDWASRQGNNIHHPRLHRSTFNPVPHISEKDSAWVKFTSAPNAKSGGDGQRGFVHRLPANIQPEARRRRS